MTCVGPPWRRSVPAPPCSRSTASVRIALLISPGCSAPAPGKGIRLPAMIDEAAIALLAERLRTPLQIEQYLTLAFEHGFRSGDDQARQGLTMPQHDWQQWIGGSRY